MKNLEIKLCTIYMFFDLCQLFNSDSHTYNKPFIDDKQSEHKNIKKHVRFHNIVHVVLIPTRHEYAAFRNLIWY